MAKKGDTSKAALTKAVLGLYPNNSFVKDKCIYINFTEDNELAQVKLTLTCPNVVVDNPNADAAPAACSAGAQASSIEFTEKEKETVNHLLHLLDF